MGADNGRNLNIPLETFSKVVEAIYDCALDPNNWHGTIRLIADLCESQVCILGVHDFANARSELSFNFGYQDPFIRLHEEKYGVMNPFLDFYPHAAARDRDNASHAY